MTKTLEEIKVKFSLKYTIFNLEKKMETDELYIQMFFCGNWSGYAALMWCHFEWTCENGDVGCCGVLAGVRKSVPLIWGAGGGGEGRVFEAYVYASKVAFTMKVGNVAQARQHQILMEILTKSWSKKISPLRGPH